MYTMPCGKYPTNFSNLQSLALILCNIIVRYQMVGRTTVSKADVHSGEVFFGRRVLAAAAVYLG